MECNTSEAVDVAFISGVDSRYWLPDDGSMVEMIVAVGCICSKLNDDGKVDSEGIVSSTTVDDGTGVEMKATVGERYGLVNRSGVTEVWLLVTVGMSVRGKVGAGEGVVQLWK